MKTKTTEKTENIKNIIGDTALNAKEAIKEIIHLNTKLLDQAVENNKVAVDEIKKQFQMKGQDGHLFETMNKTFSKSIVLSEETIDGIIDAYIKQIELFVDYNTKLVDAAYELSAYPANGQNEKILKLIRDNFEPSVNSMTESMKSVIESYNKHANLALNFNKKFGDNVTAQFQAFKDFQNNSTTYFNSWANDWWKQDGK